MDELKYDFACQYDPKDSPSESVIAVKTPPGLLSA
jgi:hypothetical protein